MAPQEDKLIVVHTNKSMKPGKEYRYFHPKNGCTYEIILPSPLPREKMFKFAPPPNPEALDGVGAPPTPAGFEISRNSTTGAVQCFYNKETGTVKALTDKEKFAIEKTLPLIMEDVDFGKGGLYKGYRSIVADWASCCICNCCGCSKACRIRRAVPAVNEWDLPCYGCCCCFTKDCCKTPLNTIFCFCCNYASAMEYAGVGSYNNNLACCICCNGPFIHITRAMIASKYGMKENDKWIANNAQCCPGGACQVINEVFVQEDLTWGWGKAVDDVTGEVAEKPVTEVFDVTFISGPPVAQQISRD